MCTDDCLVCMLRLCACVVAMAGTSEEDIMKAVSRLTNMIQQYAQRLVPAIPAGTCSLSTEKFRSSQKAPVV